MKNKANSICIFALLAAVLVLAACGHQTEYITAAVTKPAAENRLNIYTSLPEAVYLPIVREFENRTGIWVEVKTGDTIPLLKSIASGEENDADLLFGCQSDVIERYGEIFVPYISSCVPVIPREYTSADGLWQPFAINHLVVVYNSKLLNENQPNSWKGILQMGWNKHVAYVSPEKSDVGDVTVRTIADALGISGAEVLPVLAPELAYDSCEQVLEAVTHGKCYFGIVTEDAAIRIIVDNSDMDVIYPKEGAFLYPSAMAIFSSCTDEANAHRFVEFVQEQDVQEFLEANYALHSIYKRISPEDVGTLLENYCPDSGQEQNEASATEADRYEEVDE